MKTPISLLCLLLLAGCGKSDDNAWLGYGEGDNAFIGAPQPGWVSSLKVERGTYVHRGDLLFTLDNTAQVASRDQAAATIASAKAQLAQEQANLRIFAAPARSPERIGTRQCGHADQSRSGAIQLPAIHGAHRAAAIADQPVRGLARRRGLFADRAQCRGADRRARRRRLFPHRRICAGIDAGAFGAATEKHLCAFLRTGNVQFHQVHLGQRVRITCDGCRPLDATISFIAQQEEFTPPVIFSETNREKLVFKLEARAPGGLKLNPRTARGRAAALTWPISPSTCTD